MDERNPYEAPSAPVDDIVTGSDVMIEQVRSGQKIIIYAILVSFLAVGIRILLGDIAVLIQLGAAIASVIGVLRLAKGMGWAVVVRIFLVLISLIPLLGLLMLLSINSRATAALRKAGYKVGLMGAYK